MHDLMRRLTPAGFIRHFRQDVTYAVRMLRRGPGFAAIAIATLALGVGSSTAIFTIVDAVLLRPLPFADPQRLVMIRPSSGSRLSPTYLYEWRVQSQSFEDIAGWQDARVNLTGREEPLELLADRATTNFFDLLGVPALLGHTFTTYADLDRVEAEVVLSHGLWQRQYGGDPGVVGQPITLDGESYTIVGVMPAGFTIRTTELAESRAELWMPLSLVPGYGTGMGGFLHGVARLRSGTAVELAQVELGVIAGRIEEQYPSYSRNWRVAVIPLFDATVKDVRLTLLVLFGAVGILLAIACANVTNLLLSRAASREREFAIRLALGATKSRVVRQCLSESLVLALFGGSLGALLSAWGTHVFASAVPPGLQLPRAGEVGVSLRTLSFALIVIGVAALVSGLAPAVASARSERLTRQLAAHGFSSNGSSNLFGRKLVALQVALAVVLLAAAGLLTRSFLELSRVNPGFVPENVVTLRTTLSASRYPTDERVRVFAQELLQQIADLPGVRAAGSADYLPMTNIGAAATFEIAGRPVRRPSDRHAAWVSIVGGRYFEAMGIPLLRGRFPSHSDTERSAPVFVIDEELARRHWPDQDPLGARLVWRRADGTLSGEVIGVVGSVRWGGMASDPPATAYWWFPQVPERSVAIVARTTGNPMRIVNAIAAQVRELDQGQPVADVRVMEDYVSADLVQPRFTMLVVGGFSIAALSLAAIGLYGIVSFWVTQRTREIGIRIALGARAGDVVRLVMGRGLIPVAAGVVVGIAAALAVGRWITGVLYGVTPADPAVLLGAALFLAVIALIAAYLPARRATRVDPMATLRAE